MTKGCCKSTTNSMYFKNNNSNQSALELLVSIMAIINANAKPDQCCVRVRKDAIQHEKNFCGERVFNKKSVAGEFFFL